ncbi:hypothetical protein [Aquimonas voraii]|uniref:Molybdopterin molybdenumtransferase n=1 Tax=Aquimonas voraii TaxID=265719 RepID=A0A1G6V4I6_9GAMM|nr:hypothetical protein [Aquimonas voraii]SDD47805.1 hypothetical protein SAMN04488509_102614 [Aquimonas voraii]
MDPLLQALTESVPQPALRTEAVPVPRALGRVYAGMTGQGLRAGDALTPRQIGLLAASGEARVEVYPRPTVAVFSFGDALLQAGEPRAEGRLHDAASPMLQALLAEQRIESLAWPALPQHADRIDAALGDALDSFDLVLLSATEGAAPVLRERLPRLGVPMPAVAGAPRAWRSSRARLLWVDSEPEALLRQFSGWVAPTIAALQYRSQA